ncbi:hypothetical protein [Variovorax sp. ZT4R33]|uniref:hypothetical protein n=1 Tax=Variovorax sp. ZT4R33 TaxID=3443743 RepID=UPI003F4576AA
MVVVDTEGRGMGGEFLEVSKMLHLPHLNLVLANRGTPLFLNTLFSILQLRRDAAFDDVEAVMPELLVQAIDYLKSLGLDFEKHLYQQEVTLVGYSMARGRMCCVAYQSADASGFDMQEMDSVYLSPWDESWGQEGIDASTPGHARCIASEQVLRALVMRPDAPFGGRLLLAEVTRDDCRLSTLGRVTSRAVCGN